MWPLWKHAGAKVSTCEDENSVAEGLPEMRPELSAAAVLDRMKESAGLSSDSELAEWLKTSRSTVSKWRKRNAIPYAEAVFLALMRHASLDYLLTGKKNNEKDSKSSEIEKDFIKAALLNIYGMQIFEFPGNSDPVEKIQLMAQGVAHQYGRALLMKQKLIRQEGLSEQDAHKAALTGLELMSSAGDIFGRRSTPRKRAP